MHIIFKGLLIGNVMALIFLFGQQKFNFIQLDPATYYVSDVPILLSVTNFLALNFGVVFICTLVLYIPSFIVTKIDPSKVMRIQ